MHRKLDKKRNQNEKRKSQLSDFEKTKTRRRYIKIRNSRAYTRKLLQTFATDTGFEVICCSCLQYKSLQYCKLASKLSKERIQKFLIKKSNLLKNKTDGKYVCNLCFEDIQKDKFPKRSHKDRFNMQISLIASSKNLKENAILYNKTLQVDWIK